MVLSFPNPFSLNRLHKHLISLFSGVIWSILMLLLESFMPVLFFNSPPPPPPLSVAAQKIIILEGKLLNNKNPTVRVFLEI